VCCFAFLALFPLSLLTALGFMHAWSTCGSQGFDQAHACLLVATQTQKLCGYLLKQRFKDSCLHGSAPVVVS
jgi:hypothetical protein